ncbi:hypothetical protein KUH03_27170 [Sphingobacterium sp. E70]|uniref:hypothetical protein n=1 Tax=Sphingobacterium sp. E70 TaxID=2853439 RepID=UPI00211CA054|nr:hypothetical protein [Sphingobacterium sp. E70]ULT22931.1 hypothetical protein KUH03_27170 [Sphingobacterium sp. E70]
MEKKDAVAKEKSTQAKKATETKAAQVETKEKAVKKEATKAAETKTAQVETKEKAVKKDVTKAQKQVSAVKKMPQQQPTRQPAKNTTAIQFI